MKLLRVITMAVVLAVSFGAKAQYFDHLSIGPVLGTDGIGIELAAPIGDFVQMRAGYSFMPKFSAKTDVDVNSKKTDHVEVEGKLNMGDAKVLFDFFPIKGHGFHITAGAYIGKSEVVTGDYLVTTDADGNAKAAIKTHSFKPYLGVGFGRGVSKDKLVSVQCNLGVEFWGSPGVYAWDPNEERYVKAVKEDFDHPKANYIKTISKVGVWPVLNLRVAFRAF